MKTNFEQLSACSNKSNFSETFSNTFIKTVKLRQNIYPHAALDIQ